MMTRLYFVRHAEAEGNLYRICEGRYDGLLTDFGRSQLPCLTRYFQSVPLDAVYTSDLYRAVKTAEAVAEGAGVTAVRHPLLRELDFGLCEGLSWGEINRRYPEIQTLFYNDCQNYTAPGGESMSSAVERIRGVVAEIAARHPDSSVALIGHSTAFGAYLGAVSEGKQLRYMQNAAVTVAQTDGEHLTILDFNDISHLAGLGGKSAKGRSDIQLYYCQADAAADESYLRKCGREAWLAVYGNVRLFSGDSFYDNARGMIRENPANALIPMVGDKRAGLLLLDSRQRDEPATGHISLVYLTPEYRGMGLGTQLIGRAVIDYRAAGARTLRLNVASVNRLAQRFYARLGFYRTETFGGILNRQYVMKMDIGIPKE